MVSAIIKHITKADVAEWGFCAIENLRSNNADNSWKLSKWCGGLDALLRRASATDSNT